MTTVTTTKLPTIHEGKFVYYVTLRNGNKVRNINVGEKTFTEVTELLREAPKPIPETDKIKGGK